MDLHYIENILKIYEEKSITKAAEKLFVTQSALNQQLAKLEQELGTSIFKRNRSDWQLTEAGEAYIRTARSMMQMKKETYQQIHTIAGIQKRQVRIGLIPERGVDMFTAIYPEFHRLCPDALLEPVESNVRSMQKQISANSLDLGLITLIESQKDDNVYLHMAVEDILLAVPGSHPLSTLGGKTIKDAPVISLSRFQDTPFVLISQTSTMHDIEQQLFDEAGFAPHILFSTSSTLSKYRMVSVGVGCALLPAVFAVPGDNIVFFQLDSAPRWQITMCHRKGAVLSSYEQAFLNLCERYWHSKNLVCDHFPLF